MRRANRARRRQVEDDLACFCSGLTNRDPSHTAVDHNRSFRSRDTRSRTIHDNQSEQIGGSIGPGNSRSRQTPLNPQITCGLGSGNGRWVGGIKTARKLTRTPCRCDRFPAQSQTDSQIAGSSRYPQGCAAELLAPDNPARRKGNRCGRSAKSQSFGERRSRRSSGRDSSPNQRHLRVHPTACLGGARSLA